MSAERPGIDGGRLRTARERAGLSMGQLERAVGLKSRGYISRLESGDRGKSPTDELMNALVSTLGVTRAWLIGESDDPGRMPVARVERVVERVDQFPSRAQFMRLARAEKADEDVLLALLDERRADGVDPGIAHWRAEYKRLAAERKAFRADLRVIDDDDLEDALPPRVPSPRR